MIWLEMMLLFTILVPLTALSYFWPPINFLYALMLFITGCWIIWDIEEIRRERKAKYNEKKVRDEL